MKTHIGVWIDHRKAVVVTLTDSSEHIETITSDVEMQPRRSGDAPLKGDYESQQVPADDSRQRDLTGQLNRYYDAVIAHIQSAESLLLFGPGEAKNELNKRLAEQQLSGCVVRIETADKLTDRQITAKVRDSFAT